MLQYQTSRYRFSLFSIHFRHRPDGTDIRFHRRVELGTNYHYSKYPKFILFSERRSCFDSNYFNLFRSGHSGQCRSVDCSVQCATCQQLIFRILEASPSSVNNNQKFIFAIFISIEPQNHLTPPSLDNFIWKSTSENLLSYDEMT